jgi:hypothetical protein
MRQSVAGLLGEVVFWAWVHKYGSPANRPIRARYRVCAPHALIYRDNGCVHARLLREASGYAVYGSDGRRLGTVIELVTEREDRAEFLALRCDRIFLWRRRMVPLAAVAAVNPKKRAASLLLDRAGVEQAHERRAEEMREGWVADRIAPYADAPIAEASAAGGDAGSESPEPAGARTDGSLAPGDGSGLLAVQPSAEVRGGHVLFGANAAGYVLIERNGPPPRHAETLELNEPPGSFLVVKLARSPLPGDARVCAYLDLLS